MANSVVDKTILAATLRFAALKEAFKGISENNNNSFWLIRDACGDETYENRVDGTNTTIMDSAIETAPIGKFSGVATWLTNHDNYFRTDLGQTTAWTTYLNEKHLRYHEHFADVYNESKGNRLAARFVAAAEEKSANVLGTIAYNASAEADDVASLPSTVGLTRLGAKVTTNIVDAGTDPLKLDISVTDGTTEFDFTGSSALSCPEGTDGVVGKVTPLGGQTPSAFTHGATTTVIAIASTNGFKIGNYALVVNAAFADEYDDLDVIKEYVEITALSENTSITVKLLANTETGEFLTANAANCRVYPTFRGVTSLALTAGTQPDTSGAVKIVPVNDRTPAL